MCMCVKMDCETRLWLHSITWWLTYVIVMVGSLIIWELGNGRLALFLAIAALGSFAVMFVPVKRDD